MKSFFEAALPATWLMRLAILALGLVPLVVGFAPPAPGQAPAPRGRQPAPRPAAPAPARPSNVAVPFAAGERLNYRVSWSKYSVSAAALEMSVVEQRNFFGRPAWHFRAKAQTVDTVRMLYPLDDQFDSYTDATNLFSLQYEMYLRELGKQEDAKWRMDSDGAPLPEGVPAARVPPGTRDPLGFLYALRATDWKKTSEFRAPVFDGRRLYEVRARADGGPREVVLPSGRHQAVPIRVRVFQRDRELTDTTFSVWLAENAKRTPILIEADLPIGSGRVELTGTP